MQLYNYDSEGLYTGTSEARLDVRATKVHKEDRYLIPANCTTTPCPTPNPGYRYRWVNGQWVQEEIPAPPPTPSQGTSDPFMPLSPKQIRLVLSRHGHLQNVEPLLGSLPEPERSEALIEWEYATQFIRQHPLITAMGTALGLTKEQVDALWLEGLKL